MALQQSVSVLATVGTGQARRIVYLQASSRKPGLPYLHPGLQDRYVVVAPVIDRCR